MLYGALQARRAIARLHQAAGLNQLFVAFVGGTNPMVCRCESTNPLIRQNALVQVDRGISDQLVELAVHRLDVVEPIGRAVYFRCPRPHGAAPQGRVAMGARMGRRAHRMSGAQGIHRLRAGAESGAQLENSA
jgi:hypothetical protein